MGAAWAAAKWEHEIVPTMRWVAAELDRLLHEDGTLPNGVHLVWEETPQPVPADSGSDGTGHEPGEPPSA